MTTHRMTQDSADRTRHARGTRGPTAPARPRTSRFVAYEGGRVSVALADGSLIDDCELVSVGRGRAETIWVFTGEGDVFIPFAELLDLWPTMSSGNVPAA